MSPSPCFKQNPFFLSDFQDLKWKSILQYMALSSRHPQPCQASSACASAGLRRILSVVWCGWWMFGEFRQKLQINFNLNRARARRTSKPAPRLNNARLKHGPWAIKYAHFDTLITALSVTPTLAPKLQPTHQCSSGLQPSVARPQQNPPSVACFTRSQSKYPFIPSPSVGSSSRSGI